MALARGPLGNNVPWALATLPCRQHRCICICIKLNNKIYLLWYCCADDFLFYVETFVPSAKPILLTSLLQLKNPPPVVVLFYDQSAVKFNPRVLCCSLLYFIQFKFSCRHRRTHALISLASSLEKIIWSVVGSGFIPYLLYS